MRGKWSVGKVGIALGSGRGEGEGRKRTIPKVGREVIVEGRKRIFACGLHVRERNVFCGREIIICFRGRGMRSA